MEVRTRQQMQAARNVAVRDDTFRVGEWRVEPSRHLLARGGRDVRVEPKVMDVLLCLSARAGETVSRELLLASAWADAVVEENSLNRAVSQLRKALDDDARNPTYIETIPTRGYRLIAPVTYDHRGDSAPLASITIEPSAPRRVLPSPAATSSRRGWLVLLLAAILALALLVRWSVGWWTQDDPVRPYPKTPFTSMTGIESQEAFSPDGSRVAFVAGDDVSGPRDLYVQVVGSDTPIRITHTAATEASPAWNPSGERLAFIRRSDAECGIYVRSVPGDDERQLLACPNAIGNGLAWSPAGDVLVFSARPAPAAEGYLASLSLAAGTVSRIPIIGLPPGMPETPAFSPDGRRLAFNLISRPGANDLYTVPAGGGRARRLTFDQRSIAGLAWTPQGKALVFSSSRSGNYRLWRVPAAGGDLVWMAGVGAYDPGNPAFSPADGRMIYGEWFFEYNIWQLSLSDPSAAPVRTIASTRWEQHPAFSPDGRRVAFSSNRGGGNDIWVSDADGGQPVRLTSMGAASEASVPAWSPDGNLIAFEVYSDGQSDVYYVDAEGGRPKRLTAAPSHDVAPSWSHDSHWIFFGSNRSGSWQVWKQPVAGGPAVQVTTGGGYRALPAPEGHTLYFSRRDVPGIWKTTEDGGPEERVLDFLAPPDWGNWSVADRALILVDRDDGQRPAVVRFDLASGDTTHVVRVNNLIEYQPNLSVSRDGAHLLFTRVDHVESDLVMVDVDGG